MEPVADFKELISRKDVDQFDEGKIWGRGRADTASQAAPPQPHPPLAMTDRGS